MTHRRSVSITLLATLIAQCWALPTWGDSRPVTPPPPLPTYADLADLADSVPLVARVQVRKLTPLQPGRAQGVRPGRARFYVEAKTEAVIYGRVALGEAQRYLVDLPLDAKGKPPVLKKKSVLLFARPVPGRAGELQLVGADAQLLWDPALDARLRAVLAELNAPGAPQRITGVREAVHIPGDLAGEGETQLFLATQDGEPAAITVRRSPGQEPSWSVSFSEVVGEAGNVPARETLAWYRLACFLAPALPSGANLSGSQRDRADAAADYRFVLAQLGPCPRLRN